VKSKEISWLADFAAEYTQYDYPECLAQEDKFARLQKFRF
jgi:hypothetical protein